MDLLREMVKAGLVFDGVTVDKIENHFWQLQFPLGVIPAGTYDGGYWGDAVISETDAVLTVTVGDLYGTGDGKFAIGEGTVALNYAEHSGLAYTGVLEELITDRIKDLYPGLMADGSEQGMQGDDYLSLDVWTTQKEVDLV